MSQHSYPVPIWRKIPQSPPETCQTLQKTGTPEGQGTKTQTKQLCLCHTTPGGMQGSVH